MNELVERARRMRGGARGPDPIRRQERGRVPPRPRGVGQFRELEEPPNNPARGVTRELHTSLLDVGTAARLAKSVGRRVFFGGGLVPQRFTRPPSELNETFQIEEAIIRGPWRRTLPHGRGRPGGAI